MELNHPPTKNNNLSVSLMLCRIDSSLSSRYCTITTHPLGKPREANGVSVGCCLWGCPGSQIPLPEADHVEQHENTPEYKTVP